MLLAALRQPSGERHAARVEAGYALAGGPIRRAIPRGAARRTGDVGGDEDADQAVEQIMTGGDATPAEVLTAVQKADIAFRLMIQVRNKMVQFYDEVKNIRV
jgi:hypothetical protein